MGGSPAAPASATAGGSVAAVAFSPSPFGSRLWTSHSPSSQSTDSVSTGTEAQSTPSGGGGISESKPEEAADAFDFFAANAAAANAAAAAAFLLFFSSSALAFLSGATAATTADATPPARSRGALAHFARVAAAPQVEADLKELRAIAAAAASSTEADGSSDSDADAAR